MSGGHVYFAEALGKVKIGYSVNPEQRIQAVGEWIPVPITLLATMPGSLALEAAIHRMFAQEWSHGEWFHFTRRVHDFVERVIAGLPIPITDRDLAEFENPRRKAIAEKKRLTRKIQHVSEPLRSQIRAVPKGRAIPSKLLERAWAEIFAQQAAA